MKHKAGLIFVLFIVLLLCSTTSSAENKLNSDESYSIKIAVTINENDNIVGSFEYSNHSPQFPIQLVSFVRMGDEMYSTPYVFEMVEKMILSPNLHRIKCRKINDKYGMGELIFGTIDFREETNPKVHLVTDEGRVYIQNISENGLSLRKKYLKNVWLGH